jgi:hypothetical protein
MKGHFCTSLDPACGGHRERALEVELRLFSERAIGALVLERIGVQHFRKDGLLLIHAGEADRRAKNVVIIIQNGVSVGKTRTLSIVPLINLRISNQGCRADFHNSRH